MNSLSQEDLDHARDLMSQIESALSKLESIVQDANPHGYEQWKAYGKHVTNEFVTMGPSLPELVEGLESCVTDENEDDEDE